MASSARGAMFVKAIDSSGIVKMENMLQVCSLKRSKSLNLALKSICAPLDKSAQYDQYGCNGVPRISPHEDHEVSMNRSKCLKRLFPNQTDLRKVYAEYGAFSSGSNYFNRPHVIDAMFEEPLSWWGQSWKSKEYKEGPTKYWDIWREMMELAQLSLDDLKMQTMTFDDDNESQQLVLEDSTN
ncbi:hypothetical protein ACSBR1_027542 [Camellia fascicularis]